MAGRAATLVGTLQRNTTNNPEGAGCRLNNVTIEVDASEISTLDENLEGQPVEVEGHFERREHPESGTLLVFKAHPAEPHSFSDRSGSESTPPPPPGGSGSAG